MALRNKNLEKPWKIEWEITNLAKTALIEIVLGSILMSTYGILGKENYIVIGLFGVVFWLLGITMGVCEIKTPKITEKGPKKYGNS